ncbi:MAG: hypothetical protein EP330_28305 [Deltaproteobacteria bacterium]|nr:MAG: hypothetical protein EP330_28305 [Deltaproteobacteria bacterium]
MHHTVHEHGTRVDVDLGQGPLGIWGMGGVAIWGTGGVATEGGAAVPWPGSADAYDSLPSDDLLVLAEKGIATELDWAATSTMRVKPL